MDKEQFLKPEGVCELKWKFLLWKRYFDTGYGLTNYVKYVIALFGLSSLNLAATMMIGLVYGLVCFLIGWLWYRHKFIETDNEISNRFNLFMREMREMRDNLGDKGGQGKVVKVIHSE